MKVYRKKEYASNVVKAFIFSPDDKDLKSNLKHIKSKHEINDNNELEIELIPATKTKIIVPPDVFLCILKKKDGTCDYFSYSKKKFTEIYAEVK